MVLALAPVLGALGDRLIPASVHKDLSSSHSRDRIDIWTSFGAAIREQPILGGGFGASPRMAETPVAAAVPPPTACFSASAIRTAPPFRSGPSSASSARSWLQRCSLLRFVR